MRQACSTVGSRALSALTQAYSIFTTTSQKREFLVYELEASLAEASADKDTPMQACKAIQPALRKWWIQTVATVEDLHQKHKKEVRQERLFTMNVRGGNAGNQPKVQKPCLDFQKGACRYGDRCKFQHVVKAAGNMEVGKKPE